MIFVIGAGRSETTLTMSVLRECGADLGKVNGLNEIGAVRDRLEKPILRRAGVDPLGQDILDIRAPVDVDAPDLGRDFTTAAGDATAVKIIKGTLFWPTWVDAFPDAHWLFVYRSPRRIAESCIRTPFMKAFTSIAQWERWAKVYHDRCREIQRAVPADRFHAVLPAEYTRGATGPLSIAVEACGLKWHDDAVANVFRPERFHQ